MLLLKNNKIRKLKKKIRQKAAKKLVSNKVNDLVDQVHSILKNNDSRRSNEDSEKDVSVDSKLSSNCSRSSTQMNIDNTVDEQDVSMGEQPKTSSPNTTQTSLSVTDKNKAKRKANRVYSLINRFNSRSACDAFVRSSSKYGYVIKYSNGPVGCSICYDKYDKHKMIQQYWQCNCGVKSCLLGWKVNSCLNEPNLWFLYQTGTLHVEEEYETTVRALGHKPKTRYGIDLEIQSIYTEWLDKDDLMTAHSLRSKLIYKRKDNIDKQKLNSKLKPGERFTINERFIFNQNLIPTLKQVYNFSFSFFLFLLID